MQGIIELLASDLLEGRAPGTRGGQLAEAYVQSLYKIWGLAPGLAGGSYLQPFALEGHTTTELELDAGGTALAMRDDVMGTFAVGRSEVELRADAVFVGFGIATPIWSWDDFKDVDVRGKVIIARVNDPGLFIDGIFEGKTLTYFGRWTYHIEEAIRRGAAAILLIHTDRTAGYTWGVVQRSWGGESLLLKSETPSPLVFRGWVREASLRRALDASGLSLDQLYAASLSRSFRPKPLGLQVSIRGRQQVRELAASNVVAEIPGRTRRRIVLSAHIDHLGRRGQGAGDDIYNGAIDNGSAVAAMLLAGRELARRPAPLQHTITLLAAQAEESGLLGSKHYVQAADRASIVANINFEATPVWERAGSLMGVGGRFSTLGEDLQLVAREMGLGYTEFSLVEQGFYYRSDQFVFAQLGIPALWISAGEDDRSGQRKYTAFWKTDYHTVRDEYRADWPLEALQQTIEAAVRLVERIDRAPGPPRWRGKLPFPVAAK
jgi:Zn-dependent M28 family amino/carboxypeptidase